MGTTHPTKPEAAPLAVTPEALATLYKCEQWSPVFYAARGDLARQAEVHAARIDDYQRRLKAEAEHVAYLEGQAEENARERAADKARIKQLQAQADEWHVWASATLDLDSSTKATAEEMRQDINADIESEYDRAQKAERERDEARAALYGVETATIELQRKNEALSDRVEEWKKASDANAQAARELARVKSLAQHPDVRFSAPLGIGEELRKLLTGLV
jgi:DNA repair exonuclease SbcCD ATPase subunit